MHDNTLDACTWRGFARSCEELAGGSRNSRRSTMLATGWHKAPPPQSGHLRCAPGSEHPDRIGELSSASWSAPSTWCWTGKLRGEVDDLLPRSCRPALRTITVLDAVEFTVPEAPNRGAPDTQTWIFAGSRALEQPLAAPEEKSAGGALSQQWLSALPHRRSRPISDFTRCRSSSAPGAWARWSVAHL